MGTSNPEARGWILKRVALNNIRTILDVGAGSGNYNKLLTNNGKIKFQKFDAVEIWQPYIVEFELNNLYDNVFENDIRMHEDFFYDLVIFGDILEHMTKEDAIRVWSKTKEKAKFAFIAIPTIHCHQPAINGNPYEEHIKEDWTVKEVLETFNGITSHWQGEVTSAFWADFR